VRESAHTTDYSEAVKLLQRKLAENAGGKSASPGRVYMAGLLQLIVDDYRRNDRADLHETEQRVNKLLKPAFGHLRVTEFTTTALNNLREGLIYVNGRVTRNHEPKRAPIYGDVGPLLEMLLSRGPIESPHCVWLLSRGGQPVRSFNGGWE
jgi:hypothetical protein